MLAAPAFAQGPDAHAGHMMDASLQSPPSKQVDEALPPDADHAAEQLKKSPRHAEWVDVAVPGSPDKLKTFVVYPERRDQAPVVIVIHEIFGLTDWVRGVADQLAKEGFIAIAPDLLSGKGPNGGGTAELGDQVTQAISKLKPEELVTKLDAVRAYGVKLPGSNGKTATIGFCWGGQTSFAYALNQPALNAAVSYYGPMPADPAAYDKAKVPILGLYGGNDSRVNGGIPTAEAELKKRGVTYEPHIFAGAGHGFLRQQAGNAQAPGNMKATGESWPLALAFLRKYTK
jgi:carboxymethylenebutenolidase